MNRCNERHSNRRLISSLLLGMTFMSVAVTAAAGPMATSPYTVSVFSPSPTGISQPDSIVERGASIFVGYQNHVAKDGTDGKSSTIVKFTDKGVAKRSGTAYSASDSLGLVGTLNVDTGLIRPIVTGMNSARGLIFMTAHDEDGDVGGDN
jgi:hypothetical protein